MGQRALDREIELWRKEKDEFFASSHDSPIPAAERKSFKGLRYFPPNEQYRFEVELHRYDSPNVIEMVTSKGTRQRFFRFGYFAFEVGGTKTTLQVYTSADGGGERHLFVPFRDKTSGKESYGAARYIDLELSPDDDYVLDFNYAYNPYCAYSEEYICPLAPPENWLPVEIGAGELGYHQF